MALKTLSLISFYYIIKVLIGLLLHCIIYIIPNKYGGQFLLVNLYNKFTKKLIFNDLIVLFLEACLEFMIGGYMNVTNPIFTVYGEWLSLI